METIIILILCSLIAHGSVNASMNDSFSQLNLAVQSILNDYNLQITALSQEIANIRANLTTVSTIVNDNSKTCKGVSAASNWRSYYTDTLAMTVNTSSCRFPSTPKYFTSLGGTFYNYLVTGHSAIYAPQPNSFDIYVRANGVLATEMLQWAKTYYWDINWLGVY